MIKEIKADDFRAIGCMRPEKIEHIIEEAIHMEKRCLQDPELAKVYSDVNFSYVIQELEERLAYERQIEAFETELQEPDVL